MAPADPTATLLELGAATLGESGGRPMRARVHAVWPGARLAAPAFPVHCTPGDNLAVHVGVTAAPRGSALVVDVGHVPELGYWGEVLTTTAEAHGLAGLIIDGCVPRRRGARRPPVPGVRRRDRAAGQPTKTRAGTVGVPAHVGGVEVAPGDWVVGDGDGVTVIGAATLDAVLEAGQARADKEAGFFRALTAGATTVDLLGLDTSPIERGPAR